MLFTDIKRIHTDHQKAISSNLSRVAKAKYNMIIMQHHEGFQRRLHRKLEKCASEKNS